eukprot:c24161_g1_i1 orf=3-191(-)
MVSTALTCTLFSATLRCRKKMPRGISKTNGQLSPAQYPKSCERCTQHRQGAPETERLSLSLSL